MATSPRSYLSQSSNLIEEQGLESLAIVQIVSRRKREAQHVRVLTVSLELDIHRVNSSLLLLSSLLDLLSKLHLEGLKYTPN